MDIFISNLHKDRAGISQQIPCHGQSVPQVCQIRVNPIPPCVTERLHLFRLARDVVDVAVLHIAAGRGPLEIGVELDAVGRIDVDALHLAAQALRARPSDAITCRLSPRIMRLDQLASCW